MTTTPHRADDLGTETLTPGAAPDITADGLGTGGPTGDDTGGDDSAAGGPPAAAPPAGPGDPTAPDETTDTDPPPRTPPRWVRWIVVPLLILVPLGYVLISADQSRDGGAEQEALAAAKRMLPEVPSQLLRRIYQVPIPDGTVGDAYMETNAWDRSSFYCQFTTSAGGLDTFLAQIGTSRSALTDGQVAISAAQARAAGWSFPAGRAFAGAHLHQVGDKPDHDITVDLNNPEAPVVYVVSTVNFQHGFEGG